MKDDEYNQELIQPILDHWINIIFDGSKPKFEYEMNRIAKSLQIPDYVSGKHLIIQLAEGTGKTKLFGDIICELFGKNYLSSLTDASNVLGKFNSLMEFNKWVIINEARNTDSVHGFVDYNRMKGLIIDSTIDINPKNERQRIVQNLIN